MSPTDRTRCPAPACDGVATRSTGRPVSTSVTSRAALLLALTGLLACGTGAGGTNWVLSDQDLEDLNGLSTNGLSTNGLSTNGLSTNGLSTNGLSTNGFSAWYSADPAYADMLLSYVARCALDTGKSVSYTEPSGVQHTWYGDLGLTPGWASGKAMTLDEQQLISACLAVHANKYGLHVGISVRGERADNVAIPVTATEIQNYSFAEAYFFGNLFTGDGLYSRPFYAQNSYPATFASPRGCGVAAGPYSGCSNITQRPFSGTSTVVCGFNTAVGATTCTAGGKTFRALASYLKPADTSYCGDGVCLFPETCYSATKGTGCAADCGVCK